MNGVRRKGVRSDYRISQLFQQLTTTTTIGLMSRVFANGSGDRRSIAGRVKLKN